MAVQIAADHRLGFVKFGDPDGFDLFLPARPDMGADKVDKIGAQ